jgi:hypothetical protein
VINPTDKDIGRKVVYCDRRGSKTEEGVITSFNSYCVFVRYGSSTTSAGTRREDLEWGCQ